MGGYGGGDLFGEGPQLSHVRHLAGAVSPEGFSLEARDDVEVQVENGLAIAAQAHRRILQAIAQHDSFEARTQMRLHIDQTRDDFKHIAGEEQSGATSEQKRARVDIAPESMES